MANEQSVLGGFLQPVQAQIRATGSAFWRHCGFLGLEEEEFKKRSIVVWLLIFSNIGGTIHAALYIWFGYVALAYSTIAYLVTAVLNLSYLLLSKNYEVFRMVQLSSYLIFPLGTHLIIGSYVDSSCLILAGWLAPLCAMIFAPRNTARLFIWGFLLTIGIGLLFEYQMNLPELRLPRHIRLTMFMFNMGTVALQGFFLMESFLVKKEALRIALVDEKRRTDQLLLNILPDETVIELKETGHVQARNYDSASIMFTDFVGFSRIAAALPPAKLVEMLDYYFHAFDEISERLGLEKIKTIGDAYMCVGGVPAPNDTHACDAVRAGLAICRFVQESEAYIREQCGHTFSVRVGIHTGPVVAGVVGTRKFAYDIWGDSVNVAARMEQNGSANRVNISQSTYDLVREEFQCSYRGRIQAKNRGELDMYFVE